MSARGGRPAPRWGAGGRRRPRRRIAIGVAILGALGLLGWAYRDRILPHSPPAVDLSGSDPAVREAVDAARARVKESPRSAGSWGELAMVLLAHDFIAPARSSFVRASRLDPGDPRWPYLEALAELKGVPDAQAAIASLERASNVSGNDPLPLLKLGEELLELGRAGEAARRFQRALEARPGDPRAELGLGRAAHRRGEWKEALLRLGRSAQAAPRVRATHALLAEIHFRLGDREAAERERRIAGSLPETHHWPDPHLAQVNQRWAGALSRIEWANGLFEGGRREEALDLLRKTVREQPDALLARLLLGRLLLQSGRPSEAEEALREALRRAPGAFEAHHELAAALEKQGRTADAAASYREALVHKPDFAPAHHGLGLCLLRLGDREGALKALEASVRYRPDSSSALRDLGRLLAQDGRYEEALERLRGAVRLNPADREAVQLLQGVAGRLGVTLSE